MITIENKPKEMTRTECLARTSGLQDEKGAKIEWITLDRSPSRPVDEFGHTYGFDSTIITFTSKGFRIRHKEGSYLTWHRDTITGRGYTILAGTEANIAALAASFSDGDWVIREPEIRERVAAMAKTLEDVLSRERVHVTDRFGEPAYDAQDRPITISMLDVAKARRTKSRRGSHGYIEIPNAPKVDDSDELAQLKADIEKQKKTLRDQRAQLQREIDAGNAVRQTNVATGAAIPTEYNRESLEAITPLSALKRKAREEFGIDTDQVALKVDIVNAILDKIANPEPIKIT